MDWLSQVEFSHWWMVAAVLLVLELTTKVFFFLWIGFAAAAVGFLLLVFPSIPPLTQLVLFGILTLVAAVAWRRQGGPPVGRTETAEEMHTDRLFTLQEPIVDGAGLLQVGDRIWRLIGPDLPSGTRVRVVAVEGETLRVEEASGA